MRRHDRVSGINFPVFAGKVKTGLRVQKVHIGFPQAVNRADVLPVALKAIRKHTLACVQHGGQHILTEVIRGVLVLLVRFQIRAQLLPGEDVNAHGSLVALRHSRLLVKFVNRAVRVRVQNTEAGSLLHRHFVNGDGAGRIVLLVIRNHLGVIHLVDVVAAQHNHVIRIVALNKRYILVNGICRALVPVRAAALLVRLQNMYAGVHTVEIPRLAGTDVFVQLERLILCQNTNGLNAGVHTVGKWKVDNTVLASKRNSRLCEVLGKNTETAATAACQQHCNYFLLR